MSFSAVFINKPHLLVQYMTVILMYLMGLAVSVGMWNRDFEGHALLLAITIQLAEWIGIVSWMTIILQIETGEYH